MAVDVPSRSHHDVHVDEDRDNAANAVLARMAELRMNTSELARAAQLDLGTVSDFLSGKRWPKVGTRGAMEIALAWPPGTIGQLGSGARLEDIVSASGQGDVMLDLPPAIFEGLSPNQIDELKAGIRAEAWKRRREIMGE